VRQREKEGNKEAGRRSGQAPYGLFLIYSSVLFQIHLVSNDRQRDSLAQLVAQLFDPVLHLDEGTVVRNVIHQESTFWREGGRGRREEKREPWWERSPGGESGARGGYRVRLGSRWDPAHESAPALLCPANPS